MRNGSARCRSCSLVGPAGHDWKIWARPIRYHFVMIRTALALTLVAAFASAEDSPLVALAKRTNRKVSKTPVITNETLAQSKGRFSASTAEPAPLPRAVTTASSIANAQPAAQPQTAAASSVPATPAPRPIQPAVAPAYGTSTVRNIDPATSARNIEPQSTARTITPSAPPTVTPQSSARNVQPSSTARNIQPQVVKPKVD